MSDPVGYLTIGFEAMLRKAFSPKNLAKGDWRTLTDDEVDRLLIDELHEFQTALFNGKSDEILMEAVDLLAFAAMRADLTRKALNDAAALNTISVS